MSLNENFEGSVQLQDLSWLKKPPHPLKLFQSDQLIEAIPQAELVTIEEGTHDITYRHPSQVGEAIAIFLSNLNK